MSQGEGKEFWRRGCFCHPAAVLDCIKWLKMCVVWCPYGVGDKTSRGGPESMLLWDQSFFCGEIATGAARCDWALITSSWLRNASFFALPVGLENPTHRSEDGVCGV